MFRYISTAATRTGKRATNQDNYLIRDRYRPADHENGAICLQDKTKYPAVFMVADGMGGEASGEQASWLVCSELANKVVDVTAKKRIEDNMRIIEESILTSNAHLCEMMQEKKSGRMGSTVVLLLIQGKKARVTNIGDSRAYLLRKGELTQLTVDHTEGQMMLDAGVLTEEQLKKHPSRNKLSRHLGIFESEMKLDLPQYAEIKLEDRDIFLLCSDGVCGVLDDNSIAEILGQKETPLTRRTSVLINAAYKAGSKDNMTALVVEIQ